MRDDTEHESFDGLVASEVHMSVCHDFSVALVGYCVGFSLDAGFHFLELGFDGVGESFFGYACVWFSMARVDEVAGVDASFAGADLLSDLHGFVHVFMMVDI